MIRALCVAVLLALPAAVAAEGTAALVAERLSVMKDVAQWKHVRGAPVEDLDREKVVLDKAVAVAEAEGLASDTVRPFFAAQIEAAKDIQRCWIARWEGGAALPAGAPPDLKADIRPRLIALGEAILAAIRADLSAGRSPAGEAGTIRLDCLSDAAADRVSATLAAVRLGP